MVCTLYYKVDAKHKASQAEKKRAEETKERKYTKKKEKNKEKFSPLLFVSLFFKPVILDPLCTAYIIRPLISAVWQLYWPGYEVLNSKQQSGNQSCAVSCAVAPFGG